MSGGVAEVGLDRNAGRSARRDGKDGEERSLVLRDVWGDMMGPVVVI